MVGKRNINDSNKQREHETQSVHLVSSSTKHIYIYIYIIHITLPGIMSAGMQFDFVFGRAAMVLEQLDGTHSV